MTRTRVQKEAQLLLFTSANVRCLISNLTSLGACLHVPDAKTLPPAFALTMDNARTIRLCEVVWRKFDSLGITFV